MYLHSRYAPREEARRLISSASLNINRPVLVVGLGLGYHVQELLDRGYRVGVVEQNPFVAKTALEKHLSDASFPLGVGDAATILASDGFKNFAADLPQIFIHPATERLDPEFVKRIQKGLLTEGLASCRLSIAVVGPMYGGSLPIAGYLERALTSLGHRILYVDNSVAWSFHQTLTTTVNSRRASNCVTDQLVSLLGEWAYARVMEFCPDICIVMAQAPVSQSFPIRLRQAGIVTAYWFIENWRHLRYWKDIAPLYDCFFHIQQGSFEDQLKQIGCANAAFVQTGCDPLIHTPVNLTDRERNEYDCDISFAGAGYPNRNRLLAALTDFNLKIWGVNWTAPELLRYVVGPQEWFSSETFAKIVAGSRINLNIHASNTADGVDAEADAINPRVFEIASCGGFQLCDACQGLEAFFDPHSEIPQYHDVRELRDLIGYYLQHPEDRNRLATNARKRAHSDHTYQKRAEQMLHFIFDRCGQQLMSKGLRVQRTVSEVRNRLKTDSSLHELLKDLPQDMLFTLENVTEYIDSHNAEPNFAQGVFMFLRDLKVTAETLLESHS